MYKKEEESFLKHIKYKKCWKWYCFRIYEENLDELNYIAGKKLSYVNKKAMEGTVKAHVDGGVPNIIISIDKLDEHTLGHLIYFFEKACAMSGNILGINPFDQPGVEKYKENMFRLLGKYE